VANPDSNREVLEIDEGWDDLDLPSDKPVASATASPPGGAASPAKVASPAPVATAVVEAPPPDARGGVKAVPKPSPEKRLAGKAARSAKKAARRAARKAERREREKNNNRAAIKANAARAKRSADAAQRSNGAAPPSAERKRSARVRPDERGHEEAAAKARSGWKGPIALALAAAVIAAIGWFFWMRGT
jgi:hypothetical protein